MHNAHISLPHLFASYACTKAKADAIQNASERLLCGSLEPLWLPQAQKNVLLQHNYMQYIKYGMPCKTLSGVVASDPCPVSCRSCSIQVWESSWGSTCTRSMHRTSSAGGKADPATQQNWLCLCFAACRELDASECTASTAQARCESCSKDRTQSKGRFSVLYIQCVALQAQPS